MLAGKTCGDDASDSLSLYNYSTAKTVYIQAQKNKSAAVFHRKFTAAECSESSRGFFAIRRLWLARWLCPAA